MIMAKRKAVDSGPEIRHKPFAPGFAAICKNLRSDFDEVFQSRTPKKTKKTWLAIDGRQQQSRVARASE